MAKPLKIEDLYAEERIEQGVKNFISVHFQYYGLSASEAGILEKGFRLLWDKMSTEDKISYFKKYIPPKYLFKDEYVFVNGKIKGYKKDDLSLKILSIGYMGRSLSKNTTLMVIGDDADKEKINKADELGIPTMSKEDFLEIING